MVTTEAQQVFDGVMLSDGGLGLHGRNARFNIDLSDKQHTEPHLDWLLVISEALGNLGVKPLTGYPKSYERVKRGKPFSGCRLQTRTSFFLTQQHVRWYPKGIKEIPEDITLTPTVLAHWFMGDGGSGWRGLIAVGVELASNAFCVHSVRLLEQKLLDLGLHVGAPHTDKRLVKGSKMGICLLQDSVDSFMRIVEPLIVPSFRYKIKYRRGRRGNT